MGIKHTILGIDASNLGVGYTPLKPTELKFINFFGGTTSPAKNLYGTDGQVVGSPVPKGMAVGLQCDLSNKVKTAVKHSTQMTIFGVFSAPADASRAYCITDYSDARPIGLSVYLEPNGSGGYRLTAAHGYSDSAGANIAMTTQSAAIEKNRLIAFAATFDSSVTGTLKISLTNLTLNTTTNVVNSTTVTGLPPNTADLYVGASLETASTATSRVAMGAIWQRILTPAEITEQYNQIKSYYQKVHGVTI